MKILLLFHRRQTGATIRKHILVKNIVGIQYTCSKLEEHFNKNSKNLLLLRPYSESKLELESNLSEILPLIASLSAVLPQFNPEKKKKT